MERFDNQSYKGGQRMIELKKIRAVTIGNGASVETKIGDKSKEEELLSSDILDFLMKKGYLADVRVVK